MEAVIEILKQKNMYTSEALFVDDFMEDLETLLEENAGLGIDDPWDVFEKIAPVLLNPSSFYFAFGKCYGEKMVCLVPKGEWDKEQLWDDRSWGCHMNLERYGLHEASEQVFSMDNDEGSTRQKLTVAGFTENPSIYNPKHFE